MTSSGDIQAEKPKGSSYRLVLVIVAIIVLSIVAFLVVRPNPSGSTPKNNTTSPAPAQSQ